jgi:hypothetical protein
MFLFLPRRLPRRRPKKENKGSRHLLLRHFPHGTWGHHVDLLNKIYNYKNYTHKLLAFVIVYLEIKLHNFDGSLEFQEFPNPSQHTFSTFLRKEFPKSSKLKTLSL